MQAVVKTSRIEGNMRANNDAVEPSVIPAQEHVTPVKTGAGIQPPGLWTPHVRVVLDTNILIGALITKGTPPDRLYQAWLRSEIELHASSLPQYMAGVRDD